MKQKLVTIFGIFIFLNWSMVFSQQVCPANIDFSLKSLTHWDAYTGNRGNDSNIAAVKRYYDSANPAPGGTINLSAISEYLLPTRLGIQVLSRQGVDPFGGFQIIPNVNGYQYNYSLLLGSTATTQGGFLRGVYYKILVPTSPVNQPYTMTYAYAVVLENGRHGSQSQPFFSSTLTVANPGPGTSNDSVITCASPKYFLPTKGSNPNSNVEDQLLDTAAAVAQGFSWSSLASPNLDGVTQSHLQDVWTKGWTEVTFDLSPYRGKTVILSFETDNCTPGAHFAYAYLAIRNVCSGLLISGPLIACDSSQVTYSIPALAGATYNWSFPAGWLMQNGGSSNSVDLIAGPAGGSIIVNEQNSCANLRDTIQVLTNPATVAGQVISDTTVCAGDNVGTLNIVGQRGNILNWLYSTDGSNWSLISDTTSAYSFQNLATTTIFEAVVQNGSTCDVKSTSATTVTVNQKTVGGILNPQTDNFCSNQTVADLLSLTGSKGQILNWQSSQDNTNWQDIVPNYTDSAYNAIGLTATTYYRTIVKNGVCPADTSSDAIIKLFPTPFPQANINPNDTTICYGTPAWLNAVIQIGTNYTWTNSDSLQNPGDGIISSAPFSLNAQVAPLKNADYVLQIENAGCPNLLSDTFHVDVTPEIVVYANGDTSVVVGQPLQLTASSSDPAANNYLWTPSTDLNNPDIPNPLAKYGTDVDKIIYTVRATDAIGCYGEKEITVRVFKTDADIFVPNAFTPGSSINNKFRPIPVGISELKFFRLYNRWGQLVYSTNQSGQGWDGNIDGKPQGTGTYVWTVEGISYTGRLITKKGTFVLIR
ncbi:MAG: gliding motility-associated C-terminal domain-containing protein [Chitinophagales bacterium]